MKKFVFGAIALFTLAIIAFFIENAWQTQTDTEVLVTVKEKNVVPVKDADGDADHVYRVWTDKGVFEIKDNPLKAQYQSSDLYGALTPGKQYKIKTVGVRNGYLSLFPNIYSVDSTFRK